MDPWVELRARRTAILDRWKRLALEVYPQDALRFFGGEKDRFRNPVGTVTAGALEALFDGLLARRKAAELEAHLDGIVRIRAVQDLPPSRAIGFVFLLKRAIREELAGAPDVAAAGAPWIEVDSAVDGLGLAAFDLYVRCREQIYELRASDLRRRTAKLLERAERSIASAQDDTKKVTDPLKGGSGA